jgi:hypothetical protein
MYVTKNFTHLIVKNSTNSSRSKRGKIHSLFAAATAFICLLLLPLIAIGAYTLLPAKIHYHVTKTFQISQETEPSQVFLGILLPKSGSYQTVRDMSIQWDGDQELDSRAYIDLLKLSTVMPAESKQAAVIEYDLVLPQGTASWKGPVDRFELLPQEGIESNHADIKQTASRIASETSRDLAYNIFKFTTNYLDYSETGCDDTNLSALEAFRTRMGACIAYARLMVALCRSSEIPAKMIIGLVLPDTLFSFPQVLAAGIPGSGHAWVEYNSRDTWNLADPSCGRGFSAFLAFNRNDGRHLSFGDFDHFTASKSEIINWATKNARLKDTQLTSIFASNSSHSNLTPETRISKTWDQRWLNVVLSLGAATIILCKLRDWIRSKYIPG